MCFCFFCVWSTFSSQHLAKTSPLISPNTPKILPKPAKKNTSPPQLPQGKNASQKLPPKHPKTQVFVRGVAGKYNKHVESHKSFLVARYVSPSLFSSFPPGHFLHNSWTNPGNVSADSWTFLGHAQGISWKCSGHFQENYRKCLGYFVDISWIFS